MRTSSLVSCACAVMTVGILASRPANADPCAGYSGFTPLFCEDFDTYCSPPPGSGTCTPGATADNAAFLGLWPADGTCDPVSFLDSLAAGTDVRGAFGALCVQHGFGWPGGKADRVYGHQRDLSLQIAAHPGNTVMANAVNGAGPIDKPIEPSGVPAGYVDSMDRTLRPDALKGTFYFHPLDGVNQAALANMIYYHELFLDDDRAPVDFLPTLCSGLHFVHDCNCSAWNQDATCNVGVCQGAPSCAGSCEFYECNGTCSGGPNDGQTCSRDSDCSVCVGGPKDGVACATTGDPVCLTCDSGPNQGQSCTNDASCGTGTCASGPRTGQSCYGDGDCGQCVGGYRPGGTCDEDRDCQYACGPEQQPVCEGGIHDGVACTQDAECEGTRFPVLQRSDGTVHASFAIGLMAIYDLNPCDLDQGYWPSEWRMVVYDGKTWHTLTAPLFDIPVRPHPHYQDFAPLYGWNRVDFSIGADYIEVRLTNIQSVALYSGTPACVFAACKGGASHDAACTTDADCLAGDSMIPNEYLVARVPRQYKGPFNRYAIGPAQGRDMTDPQNPGSPECLPALSSADVISDEMVLYDGTFVRMTGACCRPDGTCSDSTTAECAAAGGTFHGYETSCNTLACCAVPFADADRDGDVDQVDFAVFQACFTGEGGSISKIACTCFDRTDGTGSGPPDNAIDLNDWAKFEACASGPGVPLNAACDQ